MDGDNGRRSLDGAVQSQQPKPQAWAGHQIAQDSYILGTPPQPGHVGKERTSRRDEPDRDLPLHGAPTWASHGKEKKKIQTQASFDLTLFLGGHVCGMGKLNMGLGVESELQLPAYATATAMPDPISAVRHRLMPQLAAMLDP